MRCRPAATAITARALALRDAARVKFFSAFALLDWENDLG